MDMGIWLYAAMHTRPENPEKSADLRRFAEMPAEGIVIL
jgi:hypothetical protein